MTIFKSKQVNLDPQPWCSTDGLRLPDVTDERVTQYKPRPEFEPTRDPSPWVVALGPWRGTRVDRQVPESEWSPRRKQFDTPVNPILADYRHFHNGPESVRRWLDEREWDKSPEDTHARKVLTRLANFS